MKLEIIDDKIKIIDKKFKYKKEIKSIYKCLPRSIEKPEINAFKIAEKEIYYIKQINDIKIAKKLFENTTNIIIQGKKFYCSADLKMVNPEDYFMEDIKLIEC